MPAKLSKNEIIRRLREKIESYNPTFHNVEEAKEIIELLKENRKSLDEDVRAVSTFLAPLFYRKLENIPNEDLSSLQKWDKNFRDINQPNVATHSLPQEDRDWRPVDNPSKKTSIPVRDVRTPSSGVPPVRGRSSVPPIRLAGAAAPDVDATPRTVEQRTHAKNVEDAIREAHRREKSVLTEAASQAPQNFPPIPEFSQFEDEETGELEDPDAARRRYAFDLLRAQNSIPSVVNPMPGIAPTSELEQMAMPRIMKLLQDSAELTNDERKLLDENERQYQTAKTPSNHEAKLEGEATAALQEAQNREGRALKLLDTAEQDSRELAQPLDEKEIQRYLNFYDDDLSSRLRKKSLERYELEKNDRDRDHNRKMLASYHHNWNSGGRRQAEHDYQEREIKRRGELEEALLNMESGLSREAIGLALGQAQRDREMRLGASHGTRANANQMLSGGNFLQQAYAQRHAAHTDAERLEAARRQAALQALEGKNQTNFGQFGRQLTANEAIARYGQTMQAREQEHMDRETLAREKAAAEQAAKVNATANFVSHHPIIPGNTSAIPRHVGGAPFAPGAPPMTPAAQPGTAQQMMGLVPAIAGAYQSYNTNNAVTQNIALQNRLMQQKLAGQQGVPKP